jgi:hypothetical protein
LNLILIAIAAVLLTACGSSEPNDEPVTVAPVPVNAPTTATETATPAPIPPSAKTEDSVQTHGPHINASAFLNALVESGCQIDKAEYKEVKRERVGLAPGQSTTSRPAWIPPQAANAEPIRDLFRLLRYIICVRRHSPRTRARDI